MPTAELLLDTAASSVDVYGRRMVAGAALVPRLLPSRAILAPSAFSLLPQPRGALANLKPVPLSHASMTKLRPGQVLLQVHAVGLNFRDVLNVLGMYPGDPGPPGADCAGVVATIGAGVSHVQPGMAVFGLAAGSLGSHVISDAATLVSCFLCEHTVFLACTAAHCCCCCAHVKSGNLQAFVLCNTFQDVGWHRLVAELVIEYCITCLPTKTSSCDLIASSLARQR